jgi:hypothetical protein
LEIGVYGFFPHFEKSFSSIADPGAHFKESWHRKMQCDAVLAEGFSDEKTARGFRRAPFNRLG